MTEASGPMEFDFDADSFVVSELHYLIDVDDPHIAIGAMLSAEYLHIKHPEIPAAKRLENVVTRIALSTPGLTTEFAAQYGRETSSFPSRVLGDIAFSLMRKLADRPALRSEALELLDSYLLDLILSTR
ncbi:MAG TPA: hypothetical protein VMR34_04075 [Candidatus Saccharimonadales bacterium]|nr:hypothetical protein [Candidatus Saccharimonadales bacterium]